ncbi:MAG: hypothetical protein ABIS23_08415 [Sphingomicrobium sp.]
MTGGDGDPFAPRPLAGWYWVGAAGAFLFMALGCFAYVMHVAVDPATLPPDQRNALLAEPTWVTGAYAVTVWSGLAGAVLLLLRRKAAEGVLLGSLLAMVVWAVGMAAVAPLREALSLNDWVVVFVILAVTWTIYWFARHSRQREWLR